MRPNACVGAHCVRPTERRSAMRADLARVLLLMALSASAARAQTPTGTIVGVVSDSSGAVMAGTQVSITNMATAQSRVTSTSADGRFVANALPPASYEVVVQVAGFKRLLRAANVEAGTTTSVDFALEVGEVSETVNVAAVPPLLHHDQYQIGGVVNRAQIESLPLNGRNFLELAKLEPGVTNPLRLPDNRTFVAPLGAGLQTIPRIGSTRVTVDGASITTPTTVGTVLQVSQDAVQEFQIATVNFDASTSMTSNGAINVVTRSGSNQVRGAGFYFYRDHNLAAYRVWSATSRTPTPSSARPSSVPTPADRSTRIACLRLPGTSGAISVPCGRFSRALRNLRSSVAFFRVLTPATSSPGAWTCHSLSATRPSRGIRTTGTGTSPLSGLPICPPAGRAGRSVRARALRD